MSAVLALMSGTLSAQEAKIDNMMISVMPEYDDPRVLAIFSPVMSAETPLPFTALFNIPKSAEKIEVGMACEVPDNQGHRCKVYNTNDKGDRTELTYTAEQTRNLFFEYYWDPFNGKVGEKSFTFDYIPPFDINHLEIAVTAPKKASDFKLEPSAGNTSNSEEGLKVYNYAFDNVKKDQLISIKVSYMKNDPKPSFAKRTGTGPNTADPNAVGQQSSTGGRGRLTVILLLIFLLIAGGVMASYWRMKSLEAEAGGTVAVGRPIAKPKTQAKSKTAAKMGTTVNFCTNCGGKLDKNVKFCPNCGEKVRA